MRTSADYVKKVLGADYDDEASPDLTPYIRGANLIITRLVTKASDRGVTLSTAEQRELETWVAAHLYTKSDPVYTSRSTEGASGSFVRDPKNPEPYKSGAILLDPSGVLNAMLSQQRASGAWLGLVEDDELDYDARSSS